MPRFTASARPINGSLRHEIDVNGRHTTVTDLPWSKGGSNTGPAPHELLAAGMASCVSTTIAVYGRARDVTLDGLRVEVHYDADVTPRHVETTLLLPAGFTAAQTESLRRVVERCPVRRALEAGFTFHDRLVQVVPIAADLRGVRHRPGRALPQAR